MQSPSTIQRVKYSAVTISTLMAAGIVALMILSRGKGEDITGIVAPALLITIVSGFVAIVAAILQKRAEKASGTKEEGCL
jgi:ABC-type sulfate transport system permease component